MKLDITATEVQQICNSARQKIETLFNKCVDNQKQIQQLQEEENSLENINKITNLKNEVGTCENEFKIEIERIKNENIKFVNDFDAIKQYVSEFREEVENSLERFNHLTSYAERTASEENELQKLLQKLQGFKNKEKEINELKNECGNIQGQFILFGDYLKSKGLL